jgi:molybdenum cofactor guanylyltransferase
MRLVAGLFVGGRASRMGGVAKGLLVAPDGEPIIARTRRLLEGAGATCVLVGAHAAYAGLELDTVPDDPSATGPLAGLLALLAHVGDGQAIAVACDMPLLTRDIVDRLVNAPPAPVVAPRREIPERGWVWEPLVARYDARLVLPVARRFASRGGRKLQLLLDTAGAQPLELRPEDEAALVDWDAPEHLPRAAARETR